MSPDTTQIDVGYVAHLARMHLTEEEKARFAGQIGQVLEHVAHLNALDVSGVEPTAHAMPLTNVWRADESRPSMDPERALANAPEQARGLFIVPKIVE